MNCERWQVKVSFFIWGFLPLTSLELNEEKNQLGLDSCKPIGSQDQNCLPGVWYSMNFHGKIKNLRETLRTNLQTIVCRVRLGFFCFLLDKLIRNPWGTPVGERRQSTSQFASFWQPKEIVFFIQWSSRQDIFNHDLDSQGQITSLFVCRHGF